MSMWLEPVAIQEVEVELEKQPGAQNGGPFRPGIRFEFHSRDCGWALEGLVHRSDGMGCDFQKGHPAAVQMVRMGASSGSRENGQELLSCLDETMASWPQCRGQRMRSGRIQGLFQRQCCWDLWMDCFGSEQNKAFEEQP